MKIYSLNMSTSKENKMRFFKTTFLIILALIQVQIQLSGETVEEIYAVVNDEIITASELNNFKKGMTLELQSKFSGEELAKEISKMEKNLLNLLIGRKVILSKAKEKNYDMNQYLDLVINDIMKRNNIDTKENLIIALKSQGISYDEFKKQRLEQLMQEKFIQESLGTRINIETSEIISYYKKNKKKYTSQVKYKLNCIFLNKNQYFTKEAINEKKNRISAELKSKIKNFIEIAKEYSDLEGESNNYELGTFTKGELDKALENAASNLHISEHSNWIETDSGWYILQLVDRAEPKVTKYNKVKKEIENILYEKKRQKEIIKLISELKKESYIKILK